MAALQTIGVIVAMALAYTVLALAAQHLSPAAARAVPFLIPLIAFVALAWLMWENKKDQEGS